jgi:small subunit ribosomal protein S17
MTGRVTRAKSAQTVAVRIDRSFRHPLYQKVMRRSREFLVHDTIGCHPGDWVQIVESRPISKRKNWVVESVLRHASEADVAAGQAELVPPEGSEAEA